MVMRLETNITYESVRVPPPPPPGWPPPPPVPAEYSTRLVLAASNHSSVGIMFDQRPGDERHLLLDINEALRFFIESSAGRSLSKDALPVGYNTGGGASDASPFGYVIENRGSDVYGEDNWRRE